MSFFCGSSIGGGRGRGGQDVIVMPCQCNGPMQVMIAPAEEAERGRQTGFAFDYVFDELDPQQVLPNTTQPHPQHNPTRNRNRNRNRNSNTNRNITGLTHNHKPHPVVSDPKIQDISLIFWSDPNHKPRSVWSGPQP